MVALDTENTSSLMQSDFFYLVGVMSSIRSKVFRVIRARKWLGHPARPWKKFEGGFWLCPTSWATAIRHTKTACGPLNRLTPDASKPLTSPIEFERTHRFFSAIGVLVSVVVCCCVCVCLWARERRKRFWCSSMHNIVRILYMSFFFILIWGVNIDMKEYFYNDNFNIFEIYVKFWTSWSV